MGGQQTRQRRRLRPGKIITQVIVFVGLGAIVNVAVAWGFAAWGASKTTDYAAVIACMPNGDVWLAGVERVRSFAVEKKEITSALDRDLPPDDAREYVRRDPSHTTPGVFHEWRCPILRQSWSRLGLTDCDGTGVFIKAEQGCGWPRFSLWSALAARPAEDTPQAYVASPMASISLDSGPPSYPRTSHRALPVRPIWPGFAINTLFYAIVLWLLIPGPFVLRRVIRIKRGRCPKCGYDLRHALSGGCPECGWKREGAS
ncbi:MAG: hypothetical protein SYC29_11095 [Planctomycetota bacterium]|nr:hypothetical protein [Planctomycetota bacterium]